MQEALLAAAVAVAGRRACPDNPRGWLITVASRRLTDQLRSEQARRRREETVAARPPPASRRAGADDEPRPTTTTR